MKLEKVALSKLIPLEKNVRKHSEKQINEFVKSLTQHGQTRPFVIDEANNILIGNGMYAAMLQKGDKEGYALRKVGLTETQKKKLILSDNRLFSLGTDDYANIQEYIDAIVAEGDYDVAGFDEEVLREMTREAEEVAADVMSYGVETAYSGVTPTPVYEESTPTPAPQYSAQPVSTPVYENTPRPTVKRTIVCPNCGEVIHID